MSDILILGNGTSRIAKRDKILTWTGEIWVCNWAYKEGYPNITRVGTVHPEVTEKAAQYREEHGLAYEIWGKPEVKTQFIDKCFSLKKGWSTGNMMIAQAATEGYSEITTAGFDMGGRDIYQKNLLSGKQFRKQFEELKKMWPDLKIEWL